MNPIIENLNQGWDKIFIYLIFCLIFTWYWGEIYKLPVTVLFEIKPNEVYIMLFYICSIGIAIFVIDLNKICKKLNK